MPDLRSVRAWGSPIDRKLGDLVVKDDEPTKRQFRYVRYNHFYSDAEVAAALAQFKGNWSLDNINVIPFLRTAGKAYAEEHVALGHFA